MGCGIHQNIGTGCGVGKEYGIREILDTSSRCRIVVKREQECGIRRTPLTDPDVCTCSVNSVLTVHMKKKEKTITTTATLESTRVDSKEHAAAITIDLSKAALTLSTIISSLQSWLRTAKKKKAEKRKENARMMELYNLRN